MWNHTTLCHWARGTVACGLLVAVGCSSTRSSLMGDKRDPNMNIPDQRSVTVPGTAPLESQERVKHPDLVHVAYARWQEQQKQMPQARESYRKALEHDPKSTDALLGLARLDQLAGRPADAEKHLGRAQKLKPKDPVVRAAWGEYYAAQQQWAAAIGKYREAIELAPDEPLFQHQVAVIQAKSGAIDTALESFARLNGPAEAHYNVGYLLHQQGKLLEAEEHFQRAVALKPELSSATNMLARVRRERGVDATQLAVAAKPAADSPAGVIQPAAAWQNGPAAGAEQAVQITSPKPSARQLEQWQNQQAAQ